ncbi:MAG: CehA/McbA family metallohydrolase [Planctomycetes bacterium]|nr:CehA/McbA family metallohydrolase [Planctomycetota bacterium]
MTRSIRLRACTLFPLAAAVLLPASSGRSLEAAELPKVTGVERQPLVAATERLVEALQFVGAPLPAEDEKQLGEALQDTDEKRCVEAIQNVLDRHAVAGVHINPESRVEVAEGAAKKELVQQGWRTFLVKVHNEAGVTARLAAESPHAAPQFRRSTGSAQPKTEITPADAAQRFLDIAMFDNQPLKPELSGLELEYRIIQLYSRDVGRREAKLQFNVGQGTQDIGFRNAVPILFECVPAVEVVLGVKDFDGTPTTAAFVIRDKFGRVYPNPARRLAPDFFFHSQVYRHDGESMHLPPGEYSVQISRGPEYHEDTHTLTVTDGVVSQRAAFELRRWTHPATRGWFSGDHHVHAAGCAHYENPTAGVTPADMMRHILGEDLNVGCVLSWGPCWYAQKHYFEGKTSELSRPKYLMRYDVEVSGFPSSHCGHLCLLRLKEDDYEWPEPVEFDWQYGTDKGRFEGTKTTVIGEWPSWTLPVLKWGKEQGGVVGYSHSGWGLQLPDVLPDGSRQFADFRRLPEGWNGKAADKLPDYEMPRFDGIGANEYVVTVAHDVCDFISAVDTPAIWELNVWYHTLNCGFRARISGETDFPCIYGDKVGLGRIYVKLDDRDKVDFDAWVDGVRDGRSYCGDGRSHILDLRVSDTAGQNEIALGTPGSDGKISQLNLDKPGKVRVSFDASSLLAESPTPETERIRNMRLDYKPYWHIERCRIGKTRKVPVELIVNGEPVATKELEADGEMQSLSFDVDVPQSSWIAVRILPSVHTNPVFVEVGSKPIRASRKSAEWCREAVDVCWNAKQKNIRDYDRPAAEAAYKEAAAIYARIAEEAEE